MGQNERVTAKASSSTLRRLLLVLMVAALLVLALAVPAFAAGPGFNQCSNSGVDRGHIQGAIHSGRCA